jgi:hypothetical protein
VENIKETKSEGADVDLELTKKEEKPEESKEKETEEEEEKEDEEKEEEVPRIKKKKIRTILWSWTKQLFNWIITFPIYEFFLNIFGSDLVFYVYIGNTTFIYFSHPNRSGLCSLLPSEPLRTGHPAVHHHPQLFRLGVFIRIFD